MTRAFICKAGILIFCAILASGCAEDVSLDELKSKHNNLSSRLEQKSTSLEQAKQNQGSIRTYLWDSEQVDRLQKDIKYLKKSIHHLDDQIARSEAGLDSSSKHRVPIFLIVVAGLVVAAVLALVGEAGLFGDGVFGGFLMISSMFAGLYFWLF